MLTVNAISQPSAAPKTGILQTALGAYQFTPGICVIYKDGEDYDIEIQGPGVAPDGEKVYFELSSTGNEISVKLGVDERFKSSERKLLAGKYVSQEFTLKVDGKIITVTDISLVNNNGEPVKGDASLLINCNI